MKASEWEVSRKLAITHITYEDRRHRGMTDLLNTDVQHEVGHALCRSPGEGKANRVAGILEQKRLLRCLAGR